MNSYYQDYMRGGYQQGVTIPGAYARAIAIPIGGGGHSYPGRPFGFGALTDQNKTLLMIGLGVLVVGGGAFLLMRGSRKGRRRRR